MLKDESVRVIDVPILMPDGTIGHYYMRVAKEVPDSIVRQMIDKAITNIRSISNDRKTKTINGTSY